jgi:hypothetical protein
LSALAGTGIGNTSRWNFLTRAGQPGHIEGDRSTAAVVAVVHSRIGVVEGNLVLNSAAVVVEGERDDVLVGHGGAPVLYAAPGEVCGLSLTYSKSKEKGNE